MAREELPECIRPQAGGDPSDLVSRGPSEPRPYETSEPPQLVPFRPELPGLRVLGARVDGLTIAVRVDLDARRVAAWYQEAVDGQGYGTVTVPMPGFCLPDSTPLLLSESGVAQSSVRLRVQRVSPTKLKFENADLHGVFDEKGLGGCQLEITFRATFLAVSTLYSARAYVRRIADCLGKFERWTLRRVDQAVDVMGWEISSTDAKTWVTRPRAITAEYIELDGEDNLRTYRRGDKMTGFTVCPGGAVQHRLYDKPEELNAKSPEKRELEHSIWLRNGWDGVSPVARAEFQLRSAALETFGMRDPECLEGSLDSLWQYLTRKWVRMVQPGTNARKSRCTLDSRWELLTMVKFSHSADPAARSHIRRGAGAKQALGGLLSFAAAAGVRRLVVARAADPEAAETALRAEIASILAGAVPALAEALVKEHGGAGALAYVHQREQLAVARHASAGVYVLPELPPLHDAFTEPTPLELDAMSCGPIDWRARLGREPSELLDGAA